MAQNAQGALDWVQKNPDDPNAPKVRARLRALGYDAPEFGSTSGNFAAGTIQGLLDMPEGVAQMAEHLPLVGGAVRSAIPDSLRQWAKNYSERVGTSGAGQVGEFIGNLAPLAVMPETALGRAGGFFGRLAERALLPSVAQPVPQPDDDFWTQKGEQALVGTALGAPLEGTATVIDRLGAKGAAKTAAATKAQSAADQLTGQQDWRRGAQALSHQQGTLDRAAEQQRFNDARTARDAIPRQTTSDWWRRVVGPEETDPNLFRVSPETSALVRNVVGKRLNDITDQMHLEPNDPAFRERLKTIRDETEIPESDRKSWYHEEQPADEKGLIYDHTGRLLRRVTRDTEPKPPTGDFQKTVLEPLEKGPMTGRDLTNYISSLGDKAEEFARQAQGRPEAERVSLQRRADALREVQDAVIGHAASDNPELKLARDRASRAYMMWSVGNDAARATRNGVASPQQLINTLTGRLGRAGRGRARYAQSLVDPKDPYHETTTWLQRQHTAHKADLPKVRPASAVTARPPKAPAGRAAREPAEGPNRGAVLAAHVGMAHLPGGHLIPWYMRHGIARAIAPTLSRAARSVARNARRVERPAVAGVSNVVKQAEEPDMTYSAPSNFAPPR